MRVVVNGAEREVPPQATLLELLQGLGLTPATVVVERNGQVVARDKHPGTRLEQGDRLEIVRFVGGG